MWRVVGTARVPESAIEEDRVADFGPYWNRCSGVVVGGAMQLVVEVAAGNDIEIATAFLRHIAEPKPTLRESNGRGGNSSLILTRPLSW